jgi:hypothetical protein
VELYLTNYTYHNVFSRKQQKVRVYSEKQGANGRVVLEDIVEILLTNATSIPNKKISNSADYNVLTITEDKIQLSEIVPTQHEGLHLADVEQLYNFYSFCDDLAAEEIYQSLGDWLNLQVCTLIIKRLAHLGEMVKQIPFWEEYTLKVAKMFNDNEKITIREWLIKSYGLTVPWVITIFTNKVKNMMSSAYIVNAGERPDKNEENVNVYYPKTFGFVAQRIDWWNSSNDWSWLREAINSSVVVKRILDEEKKQVRALKKEGKNIDDIIQTIWGVTPTSNIVEDKNYQYDILKAFIQML